MITANLRCELYDLLSGNCINLSHRMVQKESAAQAIVGMNGTEVGGFQVRCAWGKEAGGTFPSGGGGGGGGQNYGGGYNQQQGGYQQQNQNVCMQRKLPYRTILFMLVT